MDSKVILFQEFLEKTEKYLIPLGVWPSAKNGWITIFNIIILTGYSVLVVIKNILNPEYGSIENSFTLANGNLIIVTYFVTMALKKDKFLEFLSFMKTNNRILTSDASRKLMISSGREYHIIFLALRYIAISAILVRYIQPLLEFAFIQLFKEDKTFKLPPPMGVPNFIFGEIPTYLIESVVRTIMLSTLMGGCTIFILSAIYICTQLNILASDLENFEEGDDEAINKLIQNHQEILKYAKLLNEIFAPYFFADCCLSFINLSIMMFSLLASNTNIQNFMMEGPLVSVGMSQLFFVLYFGDRLLDATSQIADAAYLSSWYSLSIKIQKKFIFIIMRGQRPQTLNVGGNNVMVASMLLFSQICQRAWGAFNILRTTVK